MLCIAYLLRYWQLDHKASECLAWSTRLSFYIGSKFKFKIYVFKCTSKDDADYVINNLFCSHPQLNYSLLNDMKPFLQKIRKYGKKSPINTDTLASKLRFGPATLISATNPMASIPTGSATASTEVVQTTGILFF